MSIEKFKYGQFSLTPEEIEKAKKEGTLGEQEAKMKAVTEGLRAKQSEEAIKQLEEAAKKEEFKEAD